MSEYWDSLGGKAISKVEYASFGVNRVVTDVWKYQTAGVWTRGGYKNLTAKKKVKKRPTWDYIDNSQWVFAKQLYYLYVRIVDYVTLHDLH